MIINILFVGIGGFFGSVIRYMVSLIPIKETTVFPVNTLFINIMGAFLIGVFSVFLKDDILDHRFNLLLRVGLCGGFTTFSTFSFETFSLIERGYVFTAFLYVLLSVILGLAAILFAYYLVEQIL
ncbi:MAG: fluoride efflux transporter CrcB [Clostridiales bacterium]|nr:fluoride efflux transporter CrcB [Clostridiales bacterium]MDY4060308.1 fluoride efflux transporter CrcB [Anaerovoracaceae bacterium]